MNAPEPRKREWAASSYKQRIDRVITKLILVTSIALTLAICDAARADAQHALIGAGIGAGIYWGLGQAGCENKVFKVGTAIIGAMFINMMWTMGDDDYNSKFESKFGSAMVGTAIVIPIALID